MYLRISDERCFKAQARQYEWLGEYLFESVPFDAAESKVYAVHY